MWRPAVGTATGGRPPPPGPERAGSSGSRRTTTRRRTPRSSSSTRDCRGGAAGFGPPLREYDRRVAYDEELAARIRARLGDEPSLTEQKMFGGLAFLVGGNMAVAASGQGGLLVHVDPAGGAELVATTAARPMEMRGRAMKGWLRVDSDDAAGDDELSAWVERGAAY